MQVIIFVCAIIPTLISHIVFLIKKNEKSFVNTIYIIFFKLFNTFSTNSVFQFSQYK